MNLNTLSETAMSIGLGAVGFVVKSVAHPDRKYSVDFKMPNGKFAITRLSDGSNYFVGGLEDRYEFAIPVARISELKSEMSELIEQKEVILARLGTIAGELGTFASVG